MLPSLNHLPLPDIPVACGDGLVEAQHLNGDIRVELPVWPNAAPGDAYQLLLDGAPVGVPVRLPDPPPPPGARLHLPLATRLLDREGAYAVAYQVQSVHGRPRHSPYRRIRIDRMAPGAHFLSPITFPAATFGIRLVGLVPGYAGMQEGDCIQTLCNGLDGPSHRVQAEDLIAGAARIAFTREDLERVMMEGGVSIRYFITDRSGNKSLKSRPTLVNIET